ARVRAFGVVCPAAVIISIAAARRPASSPNAFGFQPARIEPRIGRLRTRDRRLAVADNRRPRQRASTRVEAARIGASDAPIGDQRALIHAIAFALAPHRTDMIARDGDRYISSDAIAAPGIAPGAVIERRLVRAKRLERRRRGPLAAPRSFHFVPRQR